MKHGGGLLKIWMVFASFFVLFLLNFMFESNIGQTAMMWLIMDAFVVVLSVFMLIKNKLPSKKRVLISLAFGLVMFIALQGVSFTSVKSFIVTVLGSLAAFSVFEKYELNAIKILKSTSAKSIVLSSIIGLGIGVILGAVNIALNSGSPELNVTVTHFLTALNPAICEEIAFRALLFAVCLYFLRGNITTKRANFSCYFLMIIPHVMIHTPEQFVHYGLVSGVVSILILALLFGLPFAILQRKRDLTSAMIAHGTVDAIRFCLFGLPY
jgi:membrane protease YdiL (CAAX protease family)